MHSGFIITIAWPETLCKQAGAWYDRLMRATGFNQGNYYKVGHSALVLVDGRQGICHYFDFGRYHAPVGHGRVRDSETDHDLKIGTKAIIQDGQILNARALLLELAGNPSTHGSGPLHAAIAPVNFNSAFAAAKEMQRQSPHAYGPFIWNGTNCSRFVRTIAMAGRLSLTQHARLALPMTLTPTPMHNVTTVGASVVVIHVSETDCSVTSNPEIFVTA